MNKKKIFAIIVAILLLMIVLVAIPIVRNFIILRNIQKNIKNYSSSRNYSVHSVNNITDENNEKSKIVVDYYRKENKAVRILERTNNGRTITMSTYYDGEKTNTFFDGEDYKFVRLNPEDAISNFEEIQNYFETDNIFQTLQLSFMLKIKNVEYNGTKCYRVTYREVDTVEDYIEKNTGLRLKEIMDNQIIEIEYKFDQVDDAVFVEPDISQYTLEEDIMN